MLGTVVVYLGISIAAAGTLLGVRPMERFGVSTRREALVVMCGGALLAAIGLILPTRQSAVKRAASQLDRITPAWQFNEVHTTRVAARPEIVFQAMKTVHPDDVFLLKTLLAVRGCDIAWKTDAPGGAASSKSLLQVAQENDFVVVFDSAPREFVVAREISRPSTMATMNFLVTPDGAGGSILSTETRVFASTPSARRRFAAYWRVIRPGSAIIRRSWLRAIQRNAESTGAVT